MKYLLIFPCSELTSFQGILEKNVGFGDILLSHQTHQVNKENLLEIMNPIIHKFQSSTHILTDKNFYIQYLVLV